MKFFNVDMHVSVIEDMATQFKKLGHEVDSHSMSGHHWTLNKEQVKRGDDGKVGIGSLTVDTWERFFDDIELNKSKWHDTYTFRWGQDNFKELEEYDGFIVTYPPAFAMLYSRLLGRPDKKHRLVMNIPIRYEGPNFKENADGWRRFNDWIDVMGDYLIPVANSRYDAAYFEYFTGRPATYISSTCDYVDNFSPKWSPRFERGGKTLLAFGERTGCRKAQSIIPRVKYVRDVLGDRYRYDEIVRSPGIVWIPYNCSIMSFFEHYWLNIPMFVPTPNFLHDLAQDGLAMSQLSWRPTEDTSPLPRAGTFMCDPAHDESQMWMSLYDFYGGHEFPHLIYFDSWDHLADLIETMTPDHLRAVSAAMVANNKVREWRNTQKWKLVLEDAYGTKDAKDAP